MAGDLKACPFCSPIIPIVSIKEPVPNSTGSKRFWGVFCYGCKAKSGGYPTKQEAVDAWNTRTPDPVMSELVSTIVGTIKALNEMPPGPCDSDEVESCDDAISAAQRVMIDNLELSLARLDKKEGE